MYFPHALPNSLFFLLYGVVLLYSVSDFFQSRSTVDKDGQLDFALLHDFQSLFVPQHVFSTFYN